MNNNNSSPDIKTSDGIPENIWTALLDSDKLVAYMRSYSEVLINKPADAATRKLRQFRQEMSQIITSDCYDPNNWNILKCSGLGQDSNAKIIVEVTDNFMKYKKHRETLQEDQKKESLYADAYMSNMTMSQLISWFQRQSFFIICNSYNRLIHAFRVYKKIDTHKIVPEPIYPFKLQELNFARYFAAELQISLSDMANTKSDMEEVTRIYSNLTEAVDLYILFNTIETTHLLNMKEKNAIKQRLDEDPKLGEIFEKIKWLIDAKETGSLAKISFKSRTFLQDERSLEIIYLRDTPNNCSCFPAMVTSEFSFYRLGDMVLCSNTDNDVKLIPELQYALPKPETDSKETEEKHLEEMPLLDKLSLQAGEGKEDA